MNKMVILAIMFITFFVFTNPIYAIQEDERDWGSIISPSINYLASYSPISINTENKLLGMFYPIEQWEIDACAAGVTSDRQYSMPAGFFGVSTDLRKIYDTTAHLSAKKSVYFDNQTLYVVSWYIQPKSEIEYSIYFKKGLLKDYLLKNYVADPVQGAAGYYAEYLESNYTEVGIEYVSGDLILAMPITVVDK
ncbi:MAG: hypothetical protein ACP5NV_06705 [Candidatus Woesearchaeota archaeon]